MPLKKKRVLVMDDDDHVRSVARSILLFAEYEVDCAKDGFEAIEFYRRSLSERKYYSAVVLDLKVSHGLGGREAMTRLLEMDPDVNAIVSSGYSEDSVMSEFRRFKFKGLIRKPYSAEELQKVVHEISESVSKGT